MRNNMDLKLTRIFRLLRIAGLVLPGIGLALLPFLATGCSHETKAAEEKKGLEVGTTYPVRKDLTREVQQPGFLRPYEQTPIYTKIAGFAYEPQYDIGDYVRKGATMLELYVPEVVQDLRLKAAKVEQAKADKDAADAAKEAADAGVHAADADVKAKTAGIASAIAQVKRWQAEEDRGLAMLGKGVFDKATADEQTNQLRASEAWLDETRAREATAKAQLWRAKANFTKAVADVKVAKASVDVAQADHDQKEDWLAYRYIPAPYDGVVTLRNVHTGHFLQPVNSGSTSKAAEPLFVMMRTDKMRCILDVPERDAVFVKDGDKAVINFDAMPGVPVIGRVTRNAGTLDERARTLRLEVWLDNPTGAKINYTASEPKKDATGKVIDPGGIITSVDPVPPEGGSGYPPNTIIPLAIAGGKVAGGKNTGIRGTVDATTNSKGEVVHYTLKTSGYRYKAGRKEGAETISSVLRPYMYAHVTIVGKMENAWSVPPEAVQSDILANSARNFCFVVEDGKARKMFLQVGAVCDEGVQILRKQRFGSAEWENITGQEVIITTNTKALQDGQPISVKPQ